jgi:acetyl-CoA carboxylase biotin carboxyl carrier protein
MFKMSEIKELIKLVDQTSISELEIEKEGARIAIRKPGKAEPASYVQSAAVPAPAPAPAQPAEAPAAVTAPAPAEKDLSGYHQIVSPMVGTFYVAPSPTSPPYVKVGDRVKPDTIVCIVEAMKLMNEIEAEVSGEIVEVLAENGQLVEFGQPLFLVKRD